MDSAALPFTNSSIKQHPAPQNFDLKPSKISATFCRCELSPQSSSSLSNANSGAVRQLPTRSTSIKLLQALKKENNPLKAFTMLQGAITQKGFTPHPLVCEFLIHRLGCAGHLEQMRYVLSLMSEPTEKAFSSVTMSYAKAHMVDHALGVLDEMQML
ncbi:hypothetical protein SUGI_0412420 [Cryptomeria japonica]|nr:hypothetical protein SUGI_0412420 [Cryptomeria japonica]